MDDALFKLATWAVTAICNHPSLAGAGLVVFVLCNLTVNGLRMAWPVQTERPRWVNFFLGFLDLGALNLWRLVTMLKPGDPNPPLVSPRTGV